MYQTYYTLFSLIETLFTDEKCKNSFTESDIFSVVLFLSMHTDLLDQIPPAGKWYSSMDSTSGDSVVKVLVDWSLDETDTDTGFSSGSMDHGCSLQNL